MAEHPSPHCVPCNTVSHSIAVSKCPIYLHSLWFSILLHMVWTYVDHMSLVQKTSSKHSFKFWTVAATLTLTFNTAIQSFHKAFSSSWRCTTKPSLVAKASTGQKAQFKKKVLWSPLHYAGPHSDLDLEDSATNLFAQQSDSCWSMHHHTQFSCKRFSHSEDLIPRKTRKTQGQMIPI